MLIGLLAPLVLLAGCTPGPVVTPSGSASTPVLPVGTVNVTVGTLLPMTGSREAQGVSTEAAVELAAQRVNAAGLGVHIDVVQADSGDSEGTLLAGAKQLIAAGATVIVGPRTSAETLEAYPTITGAGVVELSPSNTLPALSSIDADGYYFRLAPSDVLQAQVLAQRILFDGATSIAIIRTDEAYSEAIDQSAVEAFKDAGADVVADKVVEVGDDAAAAARVIVKADPEAVLVVSSADGFTPIADALDNAGVDWGTVYGTDASLEVFSGRTDVPSIDGAVFSSAGVLADRDFQRAVLALNPAIDSWNYAPEAYDAVILAALAALEAGSAEGAEIRDHLRDVSGGGETVTDFTSGAEGIRAGKDIDYSGLSGPIDFAANGDVSSAFISFYAYGPRNELSWTGQTFGSVPDGQ